MGKTVAPCPPIRGPPDAAQRALDACAGEAVDTAEVTLLLCAILLVGAAWFLATLKYIEIKMKYGL